MNVYVVRKSGTDLIVGCPMADEGVSPDESAIMGIFFGIEEAVACAYRTAIKDVEKGFSMVADTGRILYLEESGSDGSRYTTITVTEIEIGKEGMY